MLIYGNIRLYFVTVVYSATSSFQYLHQTGCQPDSPHTSFTALQYSVGSYLPGHGSLRAALSATPLSPNQWDFAVIHRLSTSAFDTCSWFFSLWSCWGRRGEGGIAAPIAPICSTGKLSHAWSQDISKISASIWECVFRVKWRETVLCSSFPPRQLADGVIWTVFTLSEPECSHSYQPKTTPWKQNS